MDAWPVKGMVFYKVLMLMTADLKHKSNKGRDGFPFILGCPFAVDVAQGNKQAGITTSKPLMKPVIFTSSKVLYSYFKSPIACNSGNLEINTSLICMLFNNVEELITAALEILCFFPFSNFRQKERQKQLNIFLSENFFKYNFID